MFICWQAIGFHLVTCILNFLWPWCKCGVYLEGIGKRCTRQRKGNFQAPQLWSAPDTGIASEVATCNIDFPPLAFVTTNYSVICKDHCPWGFCGQWSLQMTLWSVVTTVSGRSSFAIFFSSPIVTISVLTFRYYSFKSILTLKSCSYFRPFHIYLYWINYLYTYFCWLI